MSGDSVATVGAGNFRRLLASAAAAVTLHAMFLVALALSGAFTPRLAEGVKRIEVLLESAPAPEVQAEAPKAVPRETPRTIPRTASPARIPAEASSDAPRQTPRETPAGAAKTGSPAQGKGAGSEAEGPAGGSASDFNIPTPKNQTVADSASRPSGSSFRESGAKAGVAESLPLAPSPAPSGDILSGTQAAATSAGTGSPSGAAQRRGEGVLVADKAGQNAGPSLDLGSLDKALGASGGGGNGTGGEGRGQGRTGSGTGGPGGGQPGASGPGGSQVLWDEPEAGGGRELLSAPKPALPQWVGAQGLTLFATVSFSLAPEGIVSSVRVERSSGYSDVDAAVMEAIRRWRFSAAKGARVLKGKVPYTITAR